MRLTEGEVVDGRYRILRRLGSGGMADVWCAEDTQLGRKVALKVLHERFAQDREFVERFRREASAAAGLQHPNVVGIFDRGEVEGTYYIAMQYVEGASMKQMIERGLDTQQALTIVRQVLEAARFAHSNGIVHRDLKPHNVLVDAEGRAMVADFGIARAGQSEITQTGSVMGTAQYLSPEQAQGLDVTPASDIYSIGVMLYEALTGRVPFEAESAVAVALKQVSEPPVPPSRLNPRLTPALDAVVLKALAKEPANRFANAAEFQRALDEAEARPYEVSGGTEAFEPVRAPVGPPAGGDGGRRLWIGLIAVGVLLGVFAAWALTRPAQVTVPDVARPGVTVEQANAVLVGAGFTVEQRGEPSSAPQGQVLETNPPGGTPADEGSTVLVIFSEGLGSARVPDVVGLSRKLAALRVREAGFAVKVTGEFSEEIAVDVVIRTVPAPDTRQSRGDAVTLVVSKGIDLVAVPDTIGQSEAGARAELEAADFVVGVDTAPSEAAEGTVFEQTPAGGGEAGRGSQVTIIVSEGPGTQPVPSVEGLRERRATNIIESDGFEVNVEEVETDDPDEDGVVVDQFPNAGTEARQGVTVTIRVGALPAPTIVPPGGVG
jgi:serine/threonine-protein kinase